MNTTVHGVERARRDKQILARYHAKINHPDYTIRKRGNPPSVIEAVARLRGGKQCCNCGSLQNPHLHHINHNWRDYRLANLKFYCQPCHMNEHHNKEQRMSTRRVWNEEQLKELKRSVNVIVEQHSVSKTEAFRRLAGSGNYKNLSATTIENYYYDKQAKSRRSKARRRAAGSHTQVFNVPNTMQLKDAYGFYEFCKKAGITIR